MKHYLVTGGAGFMGSHLVDRLITLGHRVSVIDDFSAGKEENIIQHKGNPNFSLYRRDICNDLCDIFQDNEFDALFHVAAKPRVQFSIDFPVPTHHTNINGTMYLLELARKYNVKRFVFTSSSSVYGDQDTLPIAEHMQPNPISPYALHKLVGEQYCKLYYKLYGLETVILRPFNIYGPRQDPGGGYASLIPKFSEMISSHQQPTINGDGKQTRDFTFVSDVVAAQIAAANIKNRDALGQAFNVGAGDNYSVNDVFWKLVELSNKQISPLYGPAVVEPHDTLADISRSRDILGWVPQKNFDQGLLETYNFFANKK